MLSIAIGDIGKISLNSKECYLHYKNSTKAFTPEVRRQPAHSKVITAFYKKIADKMVESEGGVFIDNLGYFTVMQYPFKEVNKAPYADQEHFFNFHSDNKPYHPMFIGIARNKYLFNIWTMDRTFSRRRVKKPLSEAIKAKKKYKTFMATLYSLYQFKA